MSFACRFAVTCALAGACGCSGSGETFPVREPPPNDEAVSANGCPLLPSGEDPVIVELASMSDVTCALDSSGAAYCWGENVGGSALQWWGRDKIDLPERGGGYCFDHIAMGAWHGCGQLLDGRAVCWGDGFGGETGIGNLGGSVPQEAIPGIDALADITDDVVQVSAGALMQIDGTVWTWGGLAQLTWGPAPQPVPELAGTALPTDGHGYCAINDDERVVCYGRNNSLGQAGTRPIHDPIPIPREVLSLPGPADEVVTGHGKVCARLKSGDVYCWGDGPPGNGEPETLGVAVKVLHVEGAISIGVGTHACAVDGDGVVWCWGDNWVGESGLPWTTYVLEPVRVQGVPPAKLVVAGGAHTCALTVDHDVYCWGSNTSGELGIGREHASTHIPQKVEIPIEVQRERAWCARIDVRRGGA